MRQIITLFQLPSLCSQMIRFPVIAISAILYVSGANADTASEIGSLLSAVGKSDCMFVRNGRKYSAIEAETHLRLKLRRGQRYATTTENFINRFASNSSVSRKPYKIECDNHQPIDSAEWLTAKLKHIRDRVE